MSALSPEARLLLLTIGQRTDTDAVLAAVREPSFNWHQLVWLADREKAVPRLRHVLRALPDGTVPTEHAAHLARIAQVTEFRMLRLEQLLANALDTLARENIDAVLLKGAGLAATVYGSFTARPMYDVDLLLRPDEAPRAWNALRKAGWVHDEEECPPEFYASHYHLPPLDDAQGTGLALELHSEPTDGAVLLPGDAVRNDARAVEIRGRRAYVPSPEHQVIHLAAHFAWTHGLASAAWRTFHDLERLISAGHVEWDAVVRAAHETRAVTSCYWTFRLARSLAGVAVPDEVLEALRPPRSARLLNVLERHYAGTLFRFSPGACPSVQLSQLLWSAGMMPRWSGHGPLRPWQRGQVWADSMGTGAAPSVSDRVKGHLDRSAQWGRYLASLIRPPRGSTRVVG